MQTPPTRCFPGPHPSAAQSGEALVKTNAGVTRASIRSPHFIGCVSLRGAPESAFGKNDGQSQYTIAFSTYYSVLRRNVKRTARQTKGYVKVAQLPASIPSPFPPGVFWRPLLVCLIVRACGDVPRFRCAACSLTARAKTAARKRRFAPLLAPFNASVCLSIRDNPGSRHLA